MRKVQKFDLASNHPVTKSDKIIGNISYEANSSLVIDNTSFQKYTCTFFETFKDSIIVDGTPYTEYQKSSTFSIYYSKNKKLLLAETSTNIAKTFLNALETNYGSDVVLSLIDFDFNKIRGNESNVKGLYFNVDGDAEIDSKAFFGNEIDGNSEAQDALDSENATYLMIALDIANFERTIGFSKKSAIVLYNKPKEQENSVNPHLELVYQVYLFVENSAHSR